MRVGAGTSARFFCIEPSITLARVPLILPSFAKVNLYLRVLGKRGDGYHDIFTVFQTVSLHDKLSFELISTGIELECDDTNVPKGESNLAVKAAELLRERYRVGAGVRIKIEKNIPMGGGLGGGSSNAAVSLIGLSRLWGLGLNPEHLMAEASLLGSDVPFFLYGGTALGTGRGTDVELTNDIEGPYMLLITPGVHVDTALAYADLKTQNLTNDDANRILRVCRSEAGSCDLIHSALINDFETVVFARFPEIGRVKQVLKELGASRVSMSGSGASVFAVFDKEETRQTALKALDREVNWRKFVVAAVSRNEYREALEIA